MAVAIIAHNSNPVSRWTQLKLKPSNLLDIRYIFLNTDFYGNSESVNFFTLLLWQNHTFDRRLSHS